MKKQSHGFYTKRLHGRYIHFFFQMMILLGFWGCTADQKKYVERVEPLEINKQKWESQQIESYQYTLETVCFCPPEHTQPVVIQVRDGMMVSVTNATDGTPVDGGLFEQVNTIPKLFDVIQDAIGNQVEGLQVQYDTVFGFPTDISIDPLKNAVDDEVRYRIANFEPNSSVERKLLFSNKQKWENQQIESYQYTLGTVCFCPPEHTQPVVIQVRDGMTISVTNATDGTPVDGGLFEQVNTIPKLFDVVLNALDHEAHVLRVMYDQDLGYPSDSYIDPIQGAADDEIHYLIGDFEAL